MNIVTYTIRAVSWSVFAACSLSLQGCAMMMASGMTAGSQLVGGGISSLIARATASDEKLLEKASFAIGRPAGDLTVVTDSLTTEMGTVNFQVADKRGAIWRCYYTSAGLSTSDALCSGISGSGNREKKEKLSTEGCSRLLQAAGRC